MSRPDFSTITPTRGGGYSFGPYRSDPVEGFQSELVRLEAEDGGLSEGVLHTRGGEKTVLLFGHPKGDFSRHYTVPGLTAAGYAVFGLRTRYMANDRYCVHEILMADIAAAIRHLRARGFERVVLIGNSGGGGLFSFYQAQASTPPPGRLTHTAAGDEYDLNSLDLPPADGLVVIAAHMGEGKFLMNTIDPSVIDENNPLSCDPALDMYNPDNGFRVPPQASSYSPEFVARFRAAQKARVAKLDAVARWRIKEVRDAEALLKEPAFAKRPLAEQQDIQRRSVATSYLTIYRTDANPASLDPSIEPSNRKAGSLWGPRPDIFNYRLGGPSSIMTPEGWLSTWSGLSSRASVADNLRHVRVPVLIVHFNGDVGALLSEITEAFDGTAATDKSIAYVDGDHFGYAADGTLGPREEASTVMAKWLETRFPAH